MEQIQIRQPKMPAAQSFIQTLLTFISRIFFKTRKKFLILREIKVYSNLPKLLLWLTLTLKNIGLDHLTKIFDFKK